MRLAYREPFSDVERRAYKEIVYANVTQSAQVSSILLSDSEIEISRKKKEGGKKLT